MPPKGQTKKKLGRSKNRGSRSSGDTSSLSEVSNIMPVYCGSCDQPIHNLADVCRCKRCKDFYHHLTDCSLLRFLIEACTLASRTLEKATSELWEAPDDIKDILPLLPSIMDKLCPACCVSLARSLTLQCYLCHKRASGKILACLGKNCTSVLHYSCYDEEQRRLRNLDDGGVIDLVEEDQESENTHVSKTSEEAILCRVEGPASEVEWHCNECKTKQINATITMPLIPALTFFNSLCEELPRNRLELLRCALTRTTTNGFTEVSLEDVLRWAIRCRGVIDIREKVFRRNEPFLMPPCTRETEGGPLSNAMIAVGKGRELNFLMQELNWDALQFLLWPRLAIAYELIHRRYGDQYHSFGDSWVMRSRTGPFVVKQRYRLLMKGKLLEKSLQNTKARKQEHSGNILLAPLFVALIDLYEVLEYLLGRWSLRIAASCVPKCWRELEDLLVNRNVARMQMINGTFKRYESNANPSHSSHVKDYAAISEILAVIGEYMAHQREILMKFQITLLHRSYLFSDCVLMADTLNKDAILPSTNRPEVTTLNLISMIVWLLHKSISGVGLNPGLDFVEREECGVYIVSAHPLQKRTLLGEYAGLAERARWSFDRGRSEADFSLINGGSTNRSIIVSGQPYANFSRFIAGVNNKDRTFSDHKNVSSIITAVLTEDVFAEPIRRHRYYAGILLSLSKDTDARDPLYLDYNAGSVASGTPFDTSGYRMLQ